MVGYQKLRTSFPYDTTQFKPVSLAKEESFGLNNIGKELGTIKWTRADWIQTFEGDVFNGCMHGYGTYTWYRNGPKHVYEGYFYANKKEGYGRMSFPDGGVFEGLHKNNRRYGPGEYTYPDGTQDIGLWIGEKLVRLFNTVDTTIPHLATTLWGENILLAYKKMVPIQRETFSSACNLLKEYGANSEITELLDSVYNPFSKDPRSCFFNKALYDGIYFSSLMQRDSCSSSIISGKKTVSISDNVTEEKSTIRRPSVLVKLSPSQEHLSSNRSIIKKPSISISIKSYPSNVFETGLTAWNNTETMLSLQQHSYNHHSFINSMSFSIMNRGKQRMPGDHELQCLELLKACMDGHHIVVSDLLINKQVYPDVMDSNGNTGLLIASVCEIACTEGKLLTTCKINECPKTLRNTGRHRTHLKLVFQHKFKIYMYHQDEIIEILLSFGANVNHVNDECLNALNICILEYISDEHNIDNWEQAFLYNKQQGPQEKIKSEWNPFKHLFMRDFTDYEYMENFCMRRHEFHMKEGYQSMTSVYKLKYNPVPSTESIAFRARSSITFKEPEEDSVSKSMKITLETILENGANPNSCEVPYFTLMLAVYSRNIHFVHLLLKHGANPNAITDPADGGLTVLHVITMLPASEITLAMCKILLEFDADPNIRTKANDEKFIMAETFGSNILTYDVDQDYDGNGENNKEMGRTALHTLCMKPDIDEDKKILRTMCTLILQKSQADPNILHMGHTPLALAIIKGNIMLVKQFLSSGMVDPNQKLHPDLGVPLTLILSNNCSSLDPNIKMKLMSLLLEYGADPLKQVTVGDFTGNVVEYAYWIFNQNNGTLQVEKTEDKMTKENEKITKKNQMLKKKQGINEGNKQSNASKVKEMIKNKKAKEEKSQSKIGKGKSDKKLNTKSDEQSSEPPPIGEKDIINNLLDHIRKRILRFIQGFVVQELLELEMYQAYLDEVSVRDFPEEIYRFIELAANILKPEDVLRCIWIIKKFKPNYMTDEQALEILNLIANYVSYQADVDYRKKYKKLISKNTKFWITLEEQEENCKMEFEEKKKLNNSTDQVTLPLKKQKKKRAPVSDQIQESKELEIKHYQWGISLGKHEEQQKASAANYIKDLPTLLQCLATFVSSVYGIEFSVVFSPYAVIPEVDSNEEKYRACFECGRAQGVNLKECLACGVVLFCSEECMRINILHNSICAAVSPWTEEEEIGEILKNIEDLQKGQSFLDKTSEKTSNGSPYNFEVKRKEKQREISVVKERELPISTETSKTIADLISKMQNMKDEDTEAKTGKAKSYEKETKVKKGVEESKDNEKSKMKKEKLKQISETSEIIFPKSSESERRKSISSTLESVRKLSSIDTHKKAGSKIISETIRRMSSLKSSLDRKPQKKLEQSKIKEIKDLIKKDVVIKGSKVKKPKKPEEDYDYLFSIFRTSMTHFKSNAQLLPNAFMADNDMYYSLYKDNPLINLNHSMV